MVRLDLFEKMFCSIFDPKEDEKIVLLYDVPTRSIKDNQKWRERRGLVDTWYMLCSDLTEKKGCSIEKMGVPATGAMNGDLSDDVITRLKKYQIIIAMTEFSMTSSLVSLVKDHSERIRCASMPLAEERMMDTVFAMDYTEVKYRAHWIKKLLEKAEYAYIEFSTDDSLEIDIRNRHAGADDGDCTYPGACINLPSGEGFIAPYEGVLDEQKRFGKSRTEGILPLVVENEILRCEIKENHIVDLKGPVEAKSRLKTFFDQGLNRRNIAELGIGCNPLARITGNVIEDEKVGVHIAYGTSRHLGGRITSDLHQDIVYAKDCLVYADSVRLSFADRNPLDLVKDAEVQYRLFR
jgi:hypothetical protein